MMTDRKNKLFSYNGLFFGLLLAFRAKNALRMPILDCDETFNFVEPLNFLLRGKGFMTWEYENKFALRSWSFIAIFGQIIRFLELIFLNKYINFQLNPKYFYIVLRFILGFFSSYSEFSLYKAISISISPSVANLYGIFTFFSVGMSHASVSFLPSSFAMILITLALAYSLDSSLYCINYNGTVISVDSDEQNSDEDEQKKITEIKDKNNSKSIAIKIAQEAEPLRCISRAFVLIFVAGVLGWPFALAMGIPIIAMRSILWRNTTFHDALAPGAFVCLCLGVSFTLFDSIAYTNFSINNNGTNYKLGLNNLVLYSFNIVKYNVLSSETSPDLFGTEPPSFYIKNLLLNFNILFPLSLIPPLVVPLAYIFSSSKLNNKNNNKNSNVTKKKGNSLWNKFVSRYGNKLPFILSWPFWFTIMILQPHKEERFLYVAYGPLLFNAAICCDIIVNFILPSLQEVLLTRVATIFCSYSFLAIVIVSSSFISNLRTTALEKYYSAPLYIYDSLINKDMENISESTLCLGQEWYRFPNSFFLPDNITPQFIDTPAFGGLVPTRFNSPPASFFSYSQPTYWNIFSRLKYVGAASLQPSGALNNLNIKNQDLYIDPKNCNYVVTANFNNDGNYEIKNLTKQLKNATFKPLKCINFLDSEHSSGIGRYLYIPKSFHRATNTKLHYVPYCIYERTFTD